MKRLLTVIPAVLLVLLTAACGTQNTLSVYPDSHTLYFKDSAKSEKASAVFFNSDTKESKEIEMRKIGEDADSCTFSCEGDPAVYNMAYFVCDGREPDRPAFQKVAFNPCVSGWYRTEDSLLPYTQDEEIVYNHTFDDVTLDGDGCKKPIHIWTPDDYDPSSKEKYATVYVLDGQNLPDFEQPDGSFQHSPGVIEQVRSMTARTGQKAIVAAIESSPERDYEMVPEIGESEDEKFYKQRHTTDYADVFEGMNGSQFSDFVAGTVVPYVQQHYNVYTDALHTSITGYSLGGLEALYITIENPDVFGTVGALSPSLWEYDDATWNAYLSQKSFADDSPFLYLYTGPKEKGDTDPDVTEMYHRLKKLGYPDGKLVLHFNEEGCHNSTIWRNVFSEFLTAMVFQRIEPLQQNEVK